MMYDYHSEMAYQEQKRKAIHDTVRHEHLANKIHRVNRANINLSNRSWLQILRRLYRLRIHISFDLEEPSPKPEATS